MKKEKSVCQCSRECHSDKWKKCVNDIVNSGKSGSVDPYAVCTTSVGQQSSEAVMAGGAGMTALTRAKVRKNA